MFGISQYPDLVKIEIPSFSVFLCLPLDMLQLPIEALKCFMPYWGKG